MAVATGLAIGLPGKLQGIPAVGAGWLERSTNRRMICYLAPRMRRINAGQVRASRGFGGNKDSELHASRSKRMFSTSPWSAGGSAPPIAWTFGVHKREFAHRCRGDVAVVAFTDFQSTRLERAQGETFLMKMIGRFFAYICLSAHNTISTGFRDFQAISQTGWSVMRPDIS